MGSVWVGWEPIVPRVLSWIRLGLASSNQSHMGVRGPRASTVTQLSRSCQEEEYVFSEHGKQETADMGRVHTGHGVNTASKKQDTGDINILICTSLLSFFFFFANHYTFI